MATAVGPCSTCCAGTLYPKEEVSKQAAHLRITIASLSGAIGATGLHPAHLGGTSLVFLNRLRDLFPVQRFPIHWPPITRSRTRGASTWSIASSPRIPVLDSLDRIPYNQICPVPPEGEAEVVAAVGVAPPTPAPEDHRSPVPQARPPRLSRMKTSALPSSPRPSPPTAYRLSTSGTNLMTTPSSEPLPTDYAIR